MKRQAMLVLSSALLLGSCGATPPASSGAATLSGSAAATPPAASSATSAAGASAAGSTMSEAAGSATGEPGAVAGAGAGAGSGAGSGQVVAGGGAAVGESTTGGAGAAGQAPSGREFLPEALVFYRAVACSGESELPAGFDAAIIGKHCTEMAERYQRFRERYVAPARAFFGEHRPQALPQRVVYPFGGGDLVSALLTFPDATEITTISLEHAGDPTRLASLAPREQRASLAAFRAAVRGLLTNNDSTSENMRKLERGGIPGQLSFHLTGAAVLGYVPVSLKFFRLDDEGRVQYLTEAEVEERRATKARRKKGTWVDTDFSDAYTNMELTLRDPASPARPSVVHRHFAANLANGALRGSALEKHLLAKGEVAAMTKAASYLLWLDSFSTIRDYLTMHAVWMASDATGLPARHAKRAGLGQRTFGRFAGAFLPDAAAGVNETMVQLWAGQPYRKLAFRYGYPDSRGQFHLMITERLPKDPP